MSATDELVVAIDSRLVFGTSSGDSTYWTSLLNGLGKLEANIRFLLLSDRACPPELELDRRFEWVTVPAKSSRWWSLVAFPLAARKLRAQVIHAQYSLSPLVKNIGVSTIHDVSFMVGPQWFRAKDRFILRTTVPAAAKRAAKIITVSETSKKEIESFIPAAVGKTVFTPLACPDWVRRIPVKEAQSRVAEALGVQIPYVLTVGTRWPRKNMRLAVDAVSMLDSRFLQNLVVTGKTGWGDLGLGARGKSVGYVDQEMLSCLYSAADLYLAPSLHEGFGIPLLEAFRCGCPVLCSSGGALPEVAGHAAVVESSWKPSAWRDTITSLLDDPSKLESLRSRGLEREGLFSWADTAQRTLEVYREVARCSTQNF